MRAWGCSRSRWGTCAATAQGGPAVGKRKRTRSQVGRGSRRKGQRGEREACDVLRAIFPEVRRRAMQARGGSEGADLENTPGWHVEVGVGNVNPRAKWEQAKHDAQDDGSLTVTYPLPTPIALTRKDRGEWLVTMRASDWVNLVRDALRSDNEAEWVIYREPRQRAEDLPEAQGEGRDR